MAKVTAAVPRRMHAGKSVFITGRYLPASVTGAKVIYSTSRPEVAEVDAAGRILGRAMARAATLTVRAGREATGYRIIVT